jgi:hypothetical protein
MKNTLLLVLSALAVGLVLIAWEAGKMEHYRAEYQASTRHVTIKEGSQ